MDTPDSYLQYSVTELILEPQQVRDAMLAACRRLSPVRLQCVCQLEDRFLVVCRPVSSLQEATREIQIDLLPDGTQESFLAQMRERWQSGYEPLGCVCDRAADGSALRFLFTQR